MQMYYLTVLPQTQATNYSSFLSSQKIVQMTCSVKMSYNHNKQVEIVDEIN